MTSEHTTPAGPGEPVFDQPGSRRLSGWKHATIRQLITELSHIEDAIRHVPNDHIAEAIRLGERERAVLAELQQRQPARHCPGRT